jgi:membrane-associated phospholipid phosphatase
VPSLHTAFALIVAVSLWPRGRLRWLRPLVALYPIAMAFSLVYTGEHYVFDVLLGWVYAAAAIAAVRVVEQRLVARRTGSVRVGDAAPELAG